jgi:predicted XRE-type DNA-binding protein
MLHNFDTVLDHHDRLEEHEENLRLKSYLDRETKKLKQYNQWKKKREALLESIREKNSTKLGAAK